MPADPRKDLEDNTGLHVVLVEPEIHWNTGNVGRSCLAAGARLHLVEPLGFSLDERQIRRAGLDYWKNVNPRLWNSWPDIESRLFDLGEPYFFSPQAAIEIWDADFTQPSVLVFGPETRGLSREILQRYQNRTVRIPQQRDSVRSLNLSTCVGIVLWEALRQRR